MSASKRRRRLGLDDSAATPGNKRPRPKLPSLPFTPDTFVSPSNDARIETRRVRLEKFLRQVAAVPAWRNHRESMRFFEVSRLSFAPGYGAKGQESDLKKLCGRWRLPLLKRKIRLWSSWNPRWVVQKESFIAYLHPKV